MSFPLNLRTGRIATAAVLLPAILLAVSSHATFAIADAASGRPASIAAPAAHAQESAPKAQSARQIESRITGLRKELRVTVDQDAQWNDLAQVMRDNAQKMRADIAERSKNLKGMSAVEDLQSYERIADEHADGLKRLVPAFQALYANMSPAQQKNADHVFGERQQHPSPRG
jgi:periplasmic protein CpxP/Spy